MAPAAFIAAPLHSLKPKNSPSIYQEQKKLRYTNTTKYPTSKSIRKAQPRTDYYVKHNREGAKLGNKTNSP